MHKVFRITCVLVIGLTLGGSCFGGTVFETKKQFQSRFQAVQERFDAAKAKGRLPRLDDAEDAQALRRFWDEHEILGVGAFDVVDLNALTLIFTAEQQILEKYMISTTTLTGKELEQARDYHDEIAMGTAMNIASIDAYLEVLEKSQNLLHMETKPDYIYGAVTMNRMMAINIIVIRAEGLYSSGVLSEENQILIAKALNAHSHFIRFFSRPEREAIAKSAERNAEQSSVSARALLLQFAVQVRAQPCENYCLTIDP